MDYRTRIRNIREDRDFTQAEIGNLLQKSQQGYNHIEAGRAECLRECFKVYDTLYSEAHGICRANVYSAVSLSDAQKEALRHTLEKKTGKRVELLCHIDPSLLGGVRVAMEGELFDGTVRFKLDRLRDALSAVTL